MSITSFPMPACITQECGLVGILPGTFVLAVEAVDDAAARSIFALVLATLSRDAFVAVLALGGTAIYVITGLLLGRKLLKCFATVDDLDQGING